MREHHIFMIRQVYIEMSFDVYRQTTSYRMRRGTCSRSVTRIQSLREELHGAPSPTSKKKKNTKKVSLKITLI